MRCSSICHFGAFAALLNEFCSIEILVVLHAPIPIDLFTQGKLYGIVFIENRHIENSSETWQSAIQWFFLLFFFSLDIVVFGQFSKHIVNMSVEENLERESHAFLSVCLPSTNAPPMPLLFFFWEKFLEYGIADRM